MLITNQDSTSTASLMASPHEQDRQFSDDEALAVSVDKIYSCSAVN